MTLPLHDCRHALDNNNSKQLSSTKADTQSVINWTVVGQLTIPATVDRLFITVIVKHVRLETSVDVLSTVDMVVQRRDGLHWLRELDDDRQAPSTARCRCAARGSISDS